MVTAVLYRSVLVTVVLHQGVSVAAVQSYIEASQSLVQLYIEASWSLQ